MKRTIALALSTVSLAAGAVVLGAVPAQAAPDCRAGAVCYVLDGTVLAEVGPGVRPGTAFDQVVNNSTSTIRIAWSGFGESSFIPGYTTSKASNDVVRPGAVLDLGDDTATTVSAVRVIR
ncbi:hypothetical protein AB3M89_15470 [Microbacterium sp. 179-I 3D2 NHS]|uniref:hypothetical protein n=1 Tax=Microbacterium sp. 179-I 3D2 NHS TaxID=3235178 RepID=UPI00399F09DC